MGEEAARKLGDVVAEYLLAQHAVLRASDRDLRDDLDAVHRTRVASRRFRSILRVFADVFDADAASALDAELAWYAGVLGAARDAEVLRVHIAETLRAAALTDRALACIDEDLRNTQRAAAEGIRREMNGARYRALRDELAAWADAPRFTPAAELPAQAVATYVKQAQHTLDRRLRRALRPHAADDVLHRARKAAKRTRYAAELAKPILGADARRIVKRATKLQEVLGEHHDTVVARELLVRLSESDPRDAFAYGIGYECERRRAKRARRRLRKVAGR